MQVAQEASEAYTAKKKAENTVKKESAKLEDLTDRRREATIQGNKVLVASLDEKIKHQEKDVESAKKLWKVIRKRMKKALVYSDSMRMISTNIRHLQMQLQVGMQKK